jgi:hypothetical protein
MAIQNNDLYVTKQNLSVSGCYMTFGNSRVLLTKEADLFYVNGICHVFKDSSSMSSGFSYIDEIKVKFQITIENLEENLYTLLYDHVKLTYTNSSDV